MEGRQRGLPRITHAADGNADRIALGAYRAAQFLARPGRCSAKHQSGRLGRRACLAADPDGRGRRRADDRVRSRHRPFHCPHVPDRSAERARQRRSGRTLPAPGGNPEGRGEHRPAGRRDVRRDGRRA